MHGAGAVGRVEAPRVTAFAGDGSTRGGGASESIRS